MGNAFDPAHFCIYDNNALVAAAHVKVLEEEGGSQHKVVAFFY